MPEVNIPETAMSVTQINEYIKNMIDSDFRLSDVWIKGEISNFKNHSTGHFYYTLKDEGGLIRCVMFRSSASKLPFLPENGMKVIAHGRISSFVRDGQYQLYADTMEPDGVGSLYIAYEQLKKKLESQGLFDISHKKPLPKIPSSIGIITSPTGAAVRDMINVTGRRFPHAKIILYPVLVQGEDAPPQLISALKYFNDTASADVIIIGRGGGSIEDLWAFNNEGLAHAVYASSIPVISAVGHETDFTICDFVADVRAPTPSAAAEIAVPDTDDLKIKFLNVIKRESTIISQLIGRNREKVNMYAKSRIMTNPKSLIDDKRMTLVLNSERITRSEENIVQKSRLKLASCAAKLEALDPLSIISRGYSAVYQSDGALIKTIDQVKPGDKITFKTAGGEADAEIEAVRKSDN